MLKKAEVINIGIQEQSEKKRYNLLGTNETNKRLKKQTWFKTISFLQEPLKQKISVVIMSKK